MDSYVLFFPTKMEILWGHSSDPVIVIQVSKACRGNTQGHHGGAMERGKKANDIFKLHQLISNVAFLRDISIIVKNNFDLNLNKHEINIQSKMR